MGIFRQPKLTRQVPGTRAAKFRLMNGADYGILVWTCTTIGAAIQQESTLDNFVYQNSI